MKPEVPAKSPAMGNPEDYTALGIPEEWIETLQKLGYTMIDKLKEVEKPRKLANHLVVLRTYSSIFLIIKKY